MVCAVALSLPLAAQADPDRPVTGGGTLPAGWRAQTDWNLRANQAPSLENVKFAAMGNGYHATLGPAAIFWRDADTVSGDYHVVAAITQTRNPEHPEAYGILVGGRDLAGDGQAYTYFLVRAYDGKYSIRRRAGQKVRPTALVEWTAHDAVMKADSATGRATNELAILVRGGRVSFLVNGREVHQTDAKDVDTAGIVGYRVNHNLDVHLGPIGIHRLGTP
ncbi:MAG TPA: hypothetical protein VNI61_11825 [Gemmatimonadales bacterium]|nr:hypothetical protein [Gemmatimonadales bacterium]